MRVIDREQAKRVAGFGSTTQVNARLLRLTQAGLLRRFFLGTKSGGQKALYALSQTGAGLVHVPFRGPRRRNDEVIVGDFFVAHQLAINEIYCDLKYRPIPIPGSKFEKWISFSEPLGSGIRIIPDGYFEVTTPEKTLSAFVEVDLGNENTRSGSERSRAICNTQSLRNSKRDSLKINLRYPRLSIPNDGCGRYKQLRSASLRKSFGFLPLIHSRVPVSGHRFGSAPGMTNAKSSFNKN